MAGAISSTTTPIFLFCQLKQSTDELHTPFSLPITGRKTRRRKHLPLCLSSSSKPLVELEFLSPKPEGDGTYRKQSAVEGSGEKLLRDIMGDNKIELYGSYGKVMNCGGGGSCGTCIVQIIDGQDLLNERTDTEKRYLKMKPDSWRLACQTIVGNKEKSGKVLVQRLPQWKK